MKHWVLIAVILMGAFLRFVYLDRVPTGISDDELDYVLTAKSVYFSGKTLDGIFSPFSFRTPPSEILVPSARAPYMILAPFIGAVKSGLGSSRIPYGVISVLTPVVLFFIALRLWGRQTALYVAFVSSVNPWSIYFGRTAFEGPLSVFFTYVFILCLLYFNNWWLLLSFVPWVVGLFSYQGLSVIYLPILLAGSIGVWKVRKGVYSRPYGAVTLIGIIVFSLYVFAPKDRGSRLDELSTPQNTSVIAQVDVGRRSSIQVPFNPIFINKYTTTARNMVGKYIGAFSSIHLFVSGEGRSTFSLWTHGWFYFFEFFLLVIGLYQAYRKNRQSSLFLSALMLIAPLPAAISTTGVSYALRSSLLYPLFCLYIGLGLATVCSVRRYSTMVRIGLVILYGMAIVNFLHIYFIQNPVNNSEAFGFSNRVLSRYIALAGRGNTPVLYIGSNVVNMYKQYIFYNNLLTRNSIPDIQRSIRTHDFMIGNVHFIECPTGKTEVFPEYTVITLPGTTCPALSTDKKNTAAVTIAQLNDNGRIFEIYHDTLCTPYALSAYQPMVAFGDLDVEDLSIEHFCRTYISQPK